MTPTDGADRAGRAEATGLVLQRGPWRMTRQGWEFPHVPPWAGCFPQKVHRLIIRGCTRAPRCHPFPCLHIILNGSLGLWTDPDHERICHAGQIFGIFPEVPYAYWDLDTPLDLIAIPLAGPLAGALLDGIGLSPSSPARSLSQDVRPAATALLTLPTDPHGALAGFHRLLEGIGAVHTPNDDAVVLRSHLRDAAFAGVSLAAIAQRLDLTRSGFFRRCRRALGASPHHLIDAMRLERADALIRDTDLPLREVAGHSGFQDPDYLTKRYRQRFGRSPRLQRQARQRKSSTDEDAAHGRR